MTEQDTATFTEMKLSLCNRALELSQDELLNVKRIS